MSISDGNEIETAALNGTIPASTAGTVETVEATEDREVHFIQVGTSETENTSWVQFGESVSPSVFGGTGVGADSTASGILGFTRGEEGEGYVDLSSAPPVWNAGEDLSLQSDNASGSQAICLAIVGYVPVGDFRRSSLRNSD